MFIWRLNDEALLKRTVQLLMNERKVQSLFLAHLAEVDRRTLYAVEGYPSLYAYCVEVLGLSESSASKRIQVMRAARKFPQIFSLVEEGKASLTALNRVAPHLRNSNQDFLLGEICGKTVREVDTFLATLYPKPEPPDNTNPLSEDRTHYSLVGDKEFGEMLKRTKDLLRHKHPKGKMMEVLKETMAHFLTANDPDIKYRKAALAKKQVKAPSQDLGHVPEHVRQVVWPKYDGSCGYVSPSGKRCGSRSFLEFDHIKPWCLGGSSHDPDNIRLLCRTHNRLCADQTLGRGFMERKIWESGLLRSKQSIPEPF